MSDRYASLKQGLVGCWIPSVSGSGLLLPDLSGRGNNGSLVNMDASDWVSSGNGRALDFDGSNDYILAPSINPAAISLSVWVYFTTDSSQVFIAKRNATDYSWEIGRNAANDQLLVRINANTNVATGGTLPINTWLHVGGTYDGSTIRAYVGGSEVGTFSYTTAIATNTVQTTLAARALFAGAEAFFPLQLDDIRIYSRALTESEIKLLASDRGIGFKPNKKLSRFSQRFTYNPPKARNYSVVRVKETDYGTLRQGLVGAWCPSLPNGGSGNTLPDVSGYGNHGTLTNMSPDDWVSSQYGRALDFDGNDDYVQRSLSYYGTGSISFWVKANAEPGVGVSFGQTASSTEIFGVAVGQNITGTLTNELITVFTVVGTARIEGYTTATRTELFDNNWHNVTVVQRTANTSYEIYLDGARKTTTVGDATLTSFGIGTPSADLIQFGTRRSSATQGVFLNGQLDDIRLYSRALTESEIRLLASRPGIGLRQESHRNTFYQFPSGARRKRILTGMP